MYHSNPFTRQNKSAGTPVLLAFALLLALIFGAGRAFAAPDADLPAALATPEGPTSYPVLKRNQKVKTWASNVDIYQADNQPIDGRVPLLLVHGLHGEFLRAFHWQKVMDKLTALPDFNAKYKIYLVRYDTEAPLVQTVPKFKTALLDLYQKTGERQISLVALSLGGNLVQESMLDPKVDSAVRLVLTMGTPFHGSPLFSTDWFEYSIYKNHSNVWSTIDRTVAYRIYFMLNHNLTQDLRWDNIDKRIPDVGYFRSIWPFGPAGDLTPSDDGNHRLFQLNTKLLPDKSKFICYAGYLKNPYLRQSFWSEVISTAEIPYVFFTSTIPAHLCREHAVLKMLNREIATVVGRRGQKSNNEPRYFYDMNDGISPLASALFLPESSWRDAHMAFESDLPRLHNSADVRVARVFRDVDHLTFVDGLHPLLSSSLLRDQLNPGQERRTIFEWIASDLLQEGTMSKNTVREEIVRVKSSQSVNDKLGTVD